MERNEAVGVAERFFDKIAVPGDPPCYYLDKFALALKVAGETMNKEIYSFGGYRPGDRNLGQFLNVWS